MTPLLSCLDIRGRRSPWADLPMSSFGPVTASFFGGECCVFSGSAQSGTDLLLHTLGLLEPLDAGEIVVDGRSISGLTPNEIQDLRNETFGFVFRHPCLLPSFSVAENVAMPLFRICGGDARGVRARTREILDFCSIGYLEGILAGRLSPAERQTAAFARALVHGPQILVAVSPVDHGGLLDLAQRAAAELGVCILWTSESPWPGTVHRVLQIEHGQIINDLRP